MRTELNMQSAGIAIFSFIYLENVITQLVKGRYLWVVLSYFAVGLLLYSAVRLHNERTHVKFFRFVLAWFPSLWLIEVSEWVEKRRKVI